jgi:CheY-like chemotaxis protein/HPt (histidine-containing phosphotransfer) domain-containing protein
MGTKPDLPRPDPTLRPGPVSSALRILVAEDNLTNQKVILRQLQSLGYIADLVADGQAAVDATAQTAYQIVLMDCRLPQMDGYEATRLIRQREQAEQAAKTIIIALTASDNPQAEHQAVAVGMDDFLTKPLRRETLAAALTKWSQVLQQTDQSAQSATELHPSIWLLEPARLALHFDLERLHQLSDWNQEFEQELLQLYLDDMQEQIQQLLQAISKQNFLQIERTAHHIHGASASVGAFQLEALSEKLELKAQQRHSTTFKLVEQFKQVFEQVQMLFQAEVSP